MTSDTRELEIAMGSHPPDCQLSNRFKVSIAPEDVSAFKLPN